MSLVLSGSASLRCVSRIQSVVFEFFGLHVGSPTWFCGRLWLLRLGYYKLTRPKEKGTDWVWIIDHTVQIGSEKCFVILGIRLGSLPPCGSCLRHEDVEPIGLYPVEHSSGSIVFEQLEEAVKITGVPRQIVSDRGTDIAKGVERFCEQYPRTSLVYDIKHKSASILKRVLNADESWLSFSQECGQTARRVRQTDLAHLCPPNQRSKSRYMNVDVLIGWGSKMLSYMEREPEEGIDAKELEEKLGWIRNYQEQISAWEELLKVVSEAESFVRKQGLSRGCHRELKKKLAPLATREETKKIAWELVSFVLHESFKAKPRERLVGSSEVIESVFGKLKQIEHNQANSGFTGLILCIAAMVSKTTADAVREAMKTVRTKDVLEWCREKLGKTVQAKRRKAFAVPKKTEQKSDQVWAVA